MKNNTNNNNGNETNGHSVAPHLFLHQKHSGGQANPLPSASAESGAPQRGESEVTAQQQNSKALAKLAAVEPIIGGTYGQAAERLLKQAMAEPWPEPVDGAALLDELSGLVSRFVVLPKRAADALALWMVHTYAFELGDVTAYIGVESPEKRCGKSTLLTLLSRLVNRPVVASNISAAAFFRVIEQTRPTLIIDEADTFLRKADELRGIMNSGYYKSTGYVVRVANEKLQTPKSPPSQGLRRAGKLQGNFKNQTSNSNAEVPS